MDKISRNCYWLSLTKLFVDEVNQNDLATLSLFCYIHTHTHTQIYLAFKNLIYFF